MRLHHYMAGLGLALLAAVAGGVASASSGPACPEDLTARVQKDYQSLTGFEARFTQTDQRLNGKGARAKGRLAYQKPGRMRWEYEPPEEQLLVTDGATVWLFDPLLENVTVQPLQAMTRGTPLSFLLGLGDLGKEFSCRAHTVTPPDDGLQYLELLPRTAVPGLAFVQLGVNTQFRFTALRMVDSEGSIRTIRLEGMTLRNSFPQGHFLFSIPDGMEVISK